MRWKSLCGHAVLNVSNALVVCVANCFLAYLPPVELLVIHVFSVITHVFLMPPLPRNLPGCLQVWSFKKKHQKPTLFEDITLSCLPPSQLRKIKKFIVWGGIYRCLIIYLFLAIKIDWRMPEYAPKFVNADKLKFAVGPLFFSNKGIIRCRALVSMMIWFWISPNTGMDLFCMVTTDWRTHEFCKKSFFPLGESKGLGKLQRENDTGGVQSRTATNGRDRWPARQEIIFFWGTSHGNMSLFISSYNNLKIPHFAFLLDSSIFCSPCEHCSLGKF